MKILLLPFLLLAVGQLFARVAEISGTIWNDTGQPLLGANMLELRITNGVQ